MEDLKEEPFIEKSKHRGLKLIITILLIAALSFGGYYYYTNYYDNPANKVSKIITGIEEKLMSKYDNSLINDKKAFKLNGLIKLNIDMKEKQEDLSKIIDLINKISLQFNGEIDLNNKINNIDINTKYDEGKLIDLKLYTENNNMYLLLNDIYDKYLYLGKEESLDIDSVEKELNTNINDIKIIIKSLTNAFNKSLNSDNIKKSQETITINDANKEATKYTLSLKDKEINNFITSILTNLKNDEEFVKTIQKIDKDANINDLDEGFKNIDIKATYEISFYTSKDLINEELLSIRQSVIVENKETKINIDVIDNDTYLLLIKDSEEEVNCKLTLNDKIFNIDLNSNIEGLAIELKANFNYEEISTITKIDTSNSKDINTLTEEEMQEISDKLSKDENILKITEMIEEIEKSIKSNINNEFDEDI